MNQIELHKKIDLLIQKGPAHTKPEEVRALILTNQDVYHYFFTKADEHWLGWLWKNGFLDVIKKKAEDPTRYGYRTPGINYLVKVAQKVPEKVAEIMLDKDTATEEGKFNPEIVDQFLRICAGLPAEQLALVIPKLHKENWVKLMGVFNQWGFEYKKMLKILADAKDYDSILILSEAILAVRTKEKTEKTTSNITSDNPFYFNDLGYTKVFEHLVAVDEEHQEKALALAVRILRNVVVIGRKEKDEKVFEATETFHLYDVDFFKLQLDEKEHLSSRDDVRSLAAVVKSLATNLIGKKCDDTQNVQRLYKQYFALSPESRSMWRLRLFVLSLCPAVFQTELNQVFFRIFETDPHYELLSGAEYQKTLRVGFSVLSEDDKRKYVNQVLEYFTRPAKQNAEDQKWHKTYGWRILSSIFAQLTDEEKKKAGEAFGRVLDPDYEPEPSITGGGFAGAIISQAPITIEELQKMSVPQIVQKLHTDWTSKALAEKYKDTSDFHHPIDAEGVGTLIKSDMVHRMKEYLLHAKLFFDRKKLDPHYTYTFLQGVFESLCAKQMEGIDLNMLFAILGEIVASGRKEAFDSGIRERESFGSWLASWTGVHKETSDVMKELLREDGKVALDFETNREKLLGVITYLLHYPDPEPKDEKEQQTRTNFRGELEYTGSDPFTTAINSVRGRAFEAFVLFTYQDGKKFAKDADVKISNDLKQAYEDVLNQEKTQTVMFMFGHYLPSFYFRDKAWIRGLSPKIFTQDATKKDLYIAAWEGFLANNLYRDIFSDVSIVELYRRGITLTPDDYTKRRYFKDLDEAVATHLALALVHFPSFGFGNELFKQFWGTENPKRHKEFISFIGRYAISREAASEWIKYNKIDIEKLKRFWDWALEHCDPDALSGFGFWINVERGILETKWLAQHVHRTLEKTKGYIEWDYGLMRSLPIFAKEAPEDTLAILRAHFLEEIAKHDPPRTWRLNTDTELIDIFRTIYEHPTTKEGVRMLINDLLPYRNGLFWGLKLVLDESRSEKPKIK